MSLHPPALRPLATERSPWLRGVLRVPGDRALSHLALILGAMARGETIVQGLHESADVFATGRAMQALGARIENRDGRWHIVGIGVGGCLEPEDVLHFSSSSQSLTLCMGLIGPCGFVSHYTGDAALAGRSLHATLDALAPFGVTRVGGRGDGLPLSLRGARLPTPADIVLDPPSAIRKAAVLLAALGIPGVSSLSEPLPTRDHAERLLAGFGARLDRRATPDGGQLIEIEGLPLLRGQQLAIAGDPSAAAHAVVAGLITPDSEILIEDVLTSPLRSGLIETLREMGGQIDIVRPRSVGGEPVGDIRIIQSALTGVTVPAERLPALVEEFPLLAVAASVATGPTVIHGLGALADRDCDQVEAVIAGLAANRVAARREGESLVIEGAGRALGGGRVQCRADASVAMAFLVLGMAADQQVTVDDQSAIAQVYPGFIADFEQLGATFLRYS